MNILNDLKYEIKYKNVINVNMRIKKDGMLSVSAPKHMPKKEIEKIILKHYDRFYKAQQEVIKANEILDVKLEDKDYIYIRGIKYQFELVEDTKFSYSIGSNKVTLYYRNLEKDYEKMIREIAHNVFNFLGAAVSLEMGLENITIQEKKFSRCFGKNYNQNAIALNYLLIHLEDIYIKHVLYHEYSHCLVFNHSKDFYQLLSKFDKNHRQNKKYIGQNLYKFC